MKIVSVIPLKKTILKDDLTYFTSLDISVGNIVSVPIRNKKVLALVTSVEDLKEAKSDVRKMKFNLRKIIENKGKSIFIKEFIEAIFDTSQYFAQNKHGAIASLIPNIFIEKYDKMVKIKNSTHIEHAKKEKINIKAEKLLLQSGLENRISVYKTLIRESFARGKSIFMVLPTEFDINKFKDQLSKGIEQFTFSIHSGIPAKKNLKNYEDIITSDHPVFIIGTAPFLSIPRKDIGTIILEHENINAYRMQRKPYFDLRTFAEIYASKINARFIMADDILRYETLGRVDTDNVNPFQPLSYRVNFNGRIEVENPKISHKKNHSPKSSEFKIFSEESLEEIKNLVADKKKVFIFALRKGLATITICRDCKETVTCKKCGSPLVLYMSNRGARRMFVCNRCEENENGDKACELCGSWNLFPLGIGTDTVHEEIKNIFKNKERIKIFKLDKESAKTKKGAEKIIKEFEENTESILIGTEMTFFYLKNKVECSMVASFDSLWSIPNFKMSEKIIQIVLSLTNITKNQIIIQTKNEKDEAIIAIRSGNLLSFIREELSDRKELGYPPFKRFIKIKYIGDKEQSKKAKQMLEEKFKEYSPMVFSGFISKIKEQYATNALLKIEPKKWSMPGISIGSEMDQNLLSKLLSLPPSFEVFVDPEDLL